MSAENAHSAPAGIAPLEQPQLARDGVGGASAVQTLAIGWIGDKHAGLPGQRHVAQIPHLKLNAPGQSGLPHMASGQLDGLRVYVRARDVERPLEALLVFLLASRRISSNFSNRRSPPASLHGEFRDSPGARYAAINAASIRMVPVPQQGSYSGCLGCQPLCSTSAAASVSRSGASPFHVR